MSGYFGIATVDQKVCDPHGVKVVAANPKVLELVSAAVVASQHFAGKDYVSCGSEKMFEDTAEAYRRVCELMWKELAEDEVVEFKQMDATPLEVLEENRDREVIVIEEMARGADNKLGYMEQVVSAAKDTDATVFLGMQVSAKVQTIQDLLNNPAFAKINKTADEIVFFSPIDTGSWLNRNNLRVEVASPRGIEKGDFAADAKTVNFWY